VIIEDQEAAISWMNWLMNEFEHSFLDKYLSAGVIHIPPVRIDQP
jgi:hypothetical protein